MSNDKQKALIAEFRTRVYRVLAREGHSDFKIDGSKIRLAHRGDLFIRYEPPRLRVSLNKLPAGMECIYDSDRKDDYQNTPMMEHYVLPELRKLQILDDLARS